jgi:hypothetical protein
MSGREAAVAHHPGFAGGGMQGGTFGAWNECHLVPKITLPLAPWRTQRLPRAEVLRAKPIYAREGAVRRNVGSLIW